MKRVLSHFEDPVELFFIVFLFLIAFYFCIASFGFQSDARIFPLFTSLATMLCIVIYFVKQLLKTPEKTEVREKTEEEKQDTKDGIKKIVLTIASFIGYILLSHLFGFLIASAVLAVSYPLLLGYRKVWGLVGSFVVNIGIVLIFQSFLGIPLSRGVILDLSFLFY
jgi:hypothetical protein